MYFSVFKIFICYSLRIFAECVDRPLVQQSTSNERNRPAKMGDSLCFKESVFEAKTEICELEYGDGAI